MREVTKAMMSYGWAMSVFGVQQMFSMFNMQGRQSSEATEAFNRVTECTADELSDVLRQTFRVGDTLQRGMLNTMFAILMPWTMGMMGGDGGRGGCGGQKGQGDRGDRGHGDRGDRGHGDRGAREDRSRMGSEGGRTSPGTHRGRDWRDSAQEMWDRAGEATARAADGAARAMAGMAESDIGGGTAASHRPYRQPGQETWRQWRMPDRPQPLRPEQTGAPRPAATGEQPSGSITQGWGPMP
jgi:hypothetical protein